MRRLSVLVGFVLAGGVWAATAATSVDHPPFCDMPDAPGVAAAQGGTAVTFTILPRGC